MLLWRRGYGPCTAASGADGLMTTYPRHIQQRVTGRFTAWLDPQNVSRSAHLSVADSIRLAWSAAQRFSFHRGTTRAAALALYVMLSMAPMLVLLVAVASYFFSFDTVRDTLLSDMHLLMGQTGAAAIQTALAARKTQHGGIVQGVIYGAVVLISASTAFAELKDSLDELWDVPRSQRSGVAGLVRERLLALAVLLLLALLLVASLMLNAGMAALGTIWGEFWSESIWARIAGSLAQAFSVLVVAGFFAAVLKLLPGTRITWRDVVLGALVTALLFDVGRHLIGLYLGHRAMASVYGAAGSLVALIIWFYYSAAIFFYGALLTHEYATRVGSRAQAQANAPLKPPEGNAGPTGETRR